MSDKIQKMVELIAGLNPADSAHFTKTNLPDSRVLAEKLGESVGAAERDEAFKAFKYQHPITAAKMLAILEGSVEPLRPAAEITSDPVDLTGANAVVTMIGGKAQQAWYRDGKKIHVGPDPKAE